MTTSNNSAILSYRFSLKNAQNFANNIIDGKDILYLFIGKTDEWGNENKPPTANDSVYVTDYEMWRDMIALKKISTADVTYIADRYSWSNGEIYEMYRDENDAFQIDSGAWSYTGTLNIGRGWIGGLGDVDSSLATGGLINSSQGTVGTAEIFENGAWSTHSTLGTGRYQHGSVGVSNSALIFGGIESSGAIKSSEEWNGYAWSAGGTLNANTYGVVGAGTQSAALAMGGKNNSGALNSSETYDGTTWSSGSNLNTVRYNAAGGGQQTSALIFGGLDSNVSSLRSTEEYNGTTFSSGGVLNTARSALGGVGETKSVGLAYSGLGVSGLNNSEEYISGIWKIKNPLNTKRYRTGSSGNQSAALAIGGFFLQDVKVVEKWSKSISGEFGLRSKQFYVYTDQRKVYKCLWNNGGLPSSVKPTSTSTSTFQTSDGYVWKYMFTVDSAEDDKWTTDNYIPIKLLETDNGSNQWDVQEASVNGAIHIIEVVSQGSGYDTNEGTFEGVDSSIVVTLANTASDENGRYITSSLYINSGTGEGQVKTIVDYNGTTKKATVNNALSPLPVAWTSTYKVLPTINVKGDGSGCLAVANLISNAITEVNVLNEGTGYTKKREFDGTSIVQVSANGGSGAILRPVISPRNGHGHNPLAELFADKVMVYRDINQSESNTFFVGNDYRQYGLIMNPISAANNQRYEETLAEQTVNLTLFANSADFVNDRIIQGVSSNASGYVVDWNASNNGVLRLTSVNNSFQVDERIEDLTDSGISANIGSISTANLTPFTGDIIYHSNILSVTRADDQSEEYRISFLFG